MIMTEGWGTKWRESKVVSCSCILESREKMKTVGVGEMWQMPEGDQALTCKSVLLKFGCAYKSLGDLIKTLIQIQKV
jgi:hypothetical protein